MLQIYIIYNYEQRLCLENEFTLETFSRTYSYTTIIITN